MKKTLKLIAVIALIIGIFALAAGIYMLVSINTMALLKLSTRTAYSYIILNKWFMLGGVALILLGVLMLVLKKKSKPETPVTP